MTAKTDKPKGSVETKNKPVALDEALAEWKKCALKLFDVQAERDALKAEVEALRSFDDGERVALKARAEKAESALMLVEKDIASGESNLLNATRRAVRAALAVRDKDKPDPFAPLTAREEQELEDDARERRHDESMESVEDEEEPSPEGGKGKP